ncbi:hypothetical protein JCM19000A_22420 [Silvimonas sp. JCM 19000]
MIHTPVWTVRSVRKPAAWHYQAARAMCCKKAPTQALTQPGRGAGKMAAAVIFNDNKPSRYGVRDEEYGSIALQPACQCLAD